MTRSKRGAAVAAGTLAVVAVVAAYRAGRAHADDIPATPSMYYGVTLENAGAPVNDTRTLRVKFFSAATAGTMNCDSGSVDVVLSNGHGRVPLGADCVAAVHTSPEQWVEVSVNTVVVGGRSRLGAVPFAVEAQRAVSAGGALAQQVVPAGMIGMFATTCPTGWALCDGTGGTPDMRGAYPKGGTAFAGRAGSNTHQHGVGSYAVGSGGAVTPTASVSIATDGAHSHVANLDWDGSNLYAHMGSGAGWSATHRVTNNISYSNTPSFSSSSGLAMETEGSHSHPGSSVSVNPIAAHNHGLSGASDVASSEPANVTLVFCVKR